MSDAHATTPGEFIYFQESDAATLDRTAELSSGTLEITDEAIVIHRDGGGEDLVIPFRHMTIPAETDRRNFLVRMIRVVYRPGRMGAGNRSIALTVPLFSAFGGPVVSNSSRLIRLQRELDEKRAVAWRNLSETA